MYVPLISDILGLFVNTLTADDKYSLCHRNNLPQPIQMHIYYKLNFFCVIFLRHILNLTETLKIFKTQDVSQMLCISEIRDHEKKFT